MFWGERYTDTDGQTMRIGVAQFNGVLATVDCGEALPCITQADAIGVRNVAVDQFATWAIITDLSQ